MTYCITKESFIFCVEFSIYSKKKLRAYFQLESVTHRVREKKTGRIYETHHCVFALINKWVLTINIISQIWKISREHHFPLFVRVFFRVFSHLFQSQSLGVSHCLCLFHFDCDSAYFIYDILYAIRRREWNFLIKMHELCALRTQYVAIFLLHQNLNKTFSLIDETTTILSSSKRFSHHRKIAFFPMLFFFSLLSWMRVVTAASTQIEWKTHIHPSYCLLFWLWCSHIQHGVKLLFAFLCTSSGILQLMIIPRFPLL